jgi:YVTN family beta-propeller protein
MVLFVDTATNAVVGSVEAGTRPWGIAISGDGRSLYTANGPSDDMSIIDVASRGVTRRIPVGRGPWGALFVERSSAGTR